MSVSLQTNAIALARPAVLDRLRANGLEVVHASWHSSDPELSDALTRAPGTHAQTSAGIAAALASGLLVDLNCVVERANAPGLPALADDVVARFVRPFPGNPLAGVSFSHPTSYHAPTAWTLHQAPFDEIEAPLLDAARRLRAAGVSVQLVGTCGFPLCLLRADPELVADQPVARDTYHPNELEHRRFHATCARCTRRDQCFGLRQEYLDTYGDRGLVPFTTASIA
jgi:MoaA/NifB/PqqE/SkfB family radical SAM enzyme